MGKCQMFLLLWLVAQLSLVLANESEDHCEQHAGCRSPDECDVLSPDSSRSGRALLQSETSMHHRATLHEVNEDAQLGFAVNGSIDLQSAPDVGSSASPPVFLSSADGHSFPKIRTLESCLTSHPPERRTHRSCAVVGRAPNTRHSGAGSAIDSHDAVFRAGLCGSEVSRHLRDDLGSKNDYCVSFWEKRTDGTIVRPLKAINSLNDLKRVAFGRTCASRHLVTHPEFLQWLDAQLDLLGAEIPASEHSVANWREQSIFFDPTCSLQRAKARDCKKVVNLSSGFIAVAVALEMCDSVDLYGFDLDTNLKASYRHVDGAPSNGRHVLREHPHAFPLERHILKTLEASGRLRFDKSMREHASLLSLNDTSVANADIDDDADLSSFALPW